MSKIYIEEALKDLKKLLEQLEFVSEKAYLNQGVLRGIELCIRELEKRLEDK